MKKNYLFFLMLLITINGICQAPEKMSYQAVIRDDTGKLLNNQTVGMRISILQGSATGTAVYVETQTPVTNANGLVSIEVGAGQKVTGEFKAIDWTKGSYFIKTEADIKGGDNYSITGISQLLSVPYALHAKTAEAVTGTIVEIQNLDNVLTQGNDGGGKQVKNIADPSEAQDAATKAYVDMLKDQISLLQTQLKDELGQYLTSDTTGIMSDIDGNTYKTVKIGNQWWMAENLKVTHFPNGNTIPLVTLADDWKAVSTYWEPKYCFYYNQTYYGETYGALYHHSAANAFYGYEENNEGQGVCPDGWHLPSDVEWKELFGYLGGVDIAGGKMKETGTSHWNTSNTGATNESGFSAFGGGLRINNGIFDEMGSSGYWWSGTSIDNQNRWVVRIRNNSSAVDTLSMSGANGFSVRCVKD